jgi:hypothetical protein
LELKKTLTLGLDPSILLSSTSPYDSILLSSASPYDSALLTLFSWVRNATSQIRRSLKIVGGQILDRPYSGQTTRRLSPGNLGSSKLGVF